MKMVAQRMPMASGSSSKNQRRVTIFVCGCLALMATTFNVTSMFQFQNNNDSDNDGVGTDENSLYSASYLPEIVTDKDVDVTEEAKAISSSSSSPLSSILDIIVTDGAVTNVAAGAAAAATHSSKHSNATRTQEDKNKASPVKSQLQQQHEQFLEQQRQRQEQQQKEQQLQQQQQQHEQQQQKEQQKKVKQSTARHNNGTSSAVPVSAPAPPPVPASKPEPAATQQSSSSSSRSLPESTNHVTAPVPESSKNANVTDGAVTNVAAGAVTNVTEISILDTITLQNTLCGGCRLAVIHPWTSCGDEIDALIMENHKKNRKDQNIAKLTLVQAAVQVAVNYPDICSQCNPVSCAADPVSEKQRHPYWRNVLSSVQATNKIIPPVSPFHDALCGDCRLAVISGGPLITCGDRIHSFMTKSEKVKNKNMTAIDSSLTLVQAAVQVAATYPEACSRCDPAACPASEKEYWRLDQKAPVVNYGRTHMLSSIPAANRIPAAAMKDLPRYFSNPANVVGPNKKYLYEYNPSIVLLPPDQIPASLVVNKSNNKDKAVYVASYRVTDINLCMPNGAKHLYNPHHFRPTHEEHLGIAFLRADLSIIDDLVVNLRTANMRVQDFRFFNLAGNLYITGEDLITPVWINVPTDIALKYNQKPLKVLYDIFQKEEDRTENALSLSVRTFTSCCSSPSCKGKNFIYFMGSGSDGDGANGSSSNTTSKILVETNPMFPHIIDEVDLNRRSRDVKKEPKDTSVSTSKGPARSHYSNMERTFFESGHYHIQQSAYRGTAGFVQLQVPNDDNNNVNNVKSKSNSKTTTGEPSNSKQLLVGISHQKIYRFGDYKLKFNHATYSSSFYAFEQTPPYRIVARSGAFCLGFSSEEENEQNYYSQLTRSKPLIIGEEENCPQIALVSGMTEKAGDGSKIILGYGINDCVPRFVEVDKSEIARLLFNPAAHTNSSYAVL